MAQPDGSPSGGNASKVIIIVVVVLGVVCLGCLGLGFIGYRAGQKGFQELNKMDRSMSGSRLLEQDVIELQAEQPEVQLSSGDVVTALLDRGKIVEDDLVDGYGHRYRFVRRPDGWDVYSVGPDGLDGTEDDINRND
ncbi:MAG: hypothetical protein R3F20_01195 [Planctomycetota bacterium]